MPPARAPPNALVVFCPAGASPEHPVVLAANDRVVTRTAFLDWADAPAVGVGAGSARKQLTTSQALRAFGRRLRFTQVAAQRPVVMPGVLEIAFTGAAWSKYLGELLASGLLLANFDSLHTLEVAIDGLTIVSIANLTVVAADLQLGESTAALAAAAPVGQRRRAGVAAISTPGRAALHPQLDLLDTANLSIASLEERHAVAPWASVCFLCGALGPCLTQASRNAAGSAARLTAWSLTNGIVKAFGTMAGDPSALASDLPGFVGQLRDRLPPAFRCRGVADLRLELRDAVLYGQDDSSHLLVETSRIALVSSDYPSIKLMDTVAE